MTNANRRPVPEEITTDLVEYLIVAVPDLGSLTRVVPALAELVQARLMRILDLVVLVRHRDGAVEVRELEAVESIAALRQVDGDVGGFLSDSDLQLAAFALTPGTACLVLVIEDEWAKPLSVAARRAQGQIIAGERIPPTRIEAVLADDLGDPGGRCEPCSGSAYPVRTGRHCSSGLPVGSVNTTAV